MSRKWYVVPSVEDAEMFAVVQDLTQYKPRPIDGYYIVADKLPIEDATFIAAAPEMYEAIQTLLSLHESGYQESKVKDWSHAIRKLHAALAKAKGGESERP